MKGVAAKKKHAGVSGFLLVALILLVGIAPAGATRSIPKLMDSGLAGDTDFLALMPRFSLFYLCDWFAIQLASW